MYQKFRRQSEIEILYQGKNYSYCPYPDCEEILFYNQQISSQLRCNAGHLFCGQCKVLGNHNQETCRCVLILYNTSRMITLFKKKLRS